MFYLFWTFFALLLFTALVVIWCALGYRLSKLNVGIMVLVAISSILLYQGWGNSSGLETYYQQQDREKLVKTFLNKYKDSDEVITLFKKRLAENPDDAKGWFLLGRLYFSQRNFAEAKIAFGRAKDLKAEDPTILLQYAQTLYFLAGQKLTPETQPYIQKLLELNPNNLDVINLLAADAYHRKDYPNALKYWQKLLVLLPEQAQEREMIQKLIKEVEEKNKTAKK